MAQQSNSTLYNKKVLFHTAATSFSLNVGHRVSYKNIHRKYYNVTVVV
jgi:hypothetical protein